ncbi:FtsK/SpoIIIE domain-containing protein, partial [uncultured Rothia sp.]|uniref:FtsK/SpoIIIE domain-containing protein n=1 Tax=uncultured Rothia sp. TaxID=316088 RepID=UPI00260A38A2
MTLFFLDHHNTTDALPYPRVLRLDGEAAPTGIQLHPGSAGSANQQALEQALNQALQGSVPGAHATARETTFQLHPAHDKDPACASIAPNSRILNESQNPGAPAISLLHILRGPDAGTTFPISRGRTSLGRAALATRGGEQPRHIHLQDPFLKPVHGSFYADSSGIRWIEKRLASSEGSEKIQGGKRVQGAEPRILRWDEPFCLGSSLCMLTSPSTDRKRTATKASATAAPGSSLASSLGSSPGEPAQMLVPLSYAGNPFEPVVVNPPAPRKLKQILLSVCLPIVVGLVIALVTGMWFLLLMSAASSLLMLLHFFGGRAENRAASQQTHQAAEQEKERALALPTAGDLAISGTSALHDAAYPAIVLGCGPRQPYLRGRNLPLGTLEKQDAPHYLPLPTPTLGHYLKLEEAHLRAYLVQLVAGYPGAVHVLLAGAESADQQRTNSLLQTLAVVPGVSVHCLPDVQQEKYLQALQSSLQSELSVPPLILMPLQASAVYAPLLTALNSGAVAESSQSRAFASPRDHNMNAPTLCVLGSAGGDSSAHAPGTLFGAAWVEYASEGSHRQSIRYRTQGYAAPPVQPTEGVYQVHPLTCEGLCQHADGLSVEAFCAALENLYRAGCEQEQGALGEAQVHQSAHLFSSLQAQSTRQKNRTDDMAVESVLQRWSAQRYASDIRCYLGVSSGGSLNIGLSEHGPHWLLGGTTGAGKSQLLRSLVLSAALRYPPERLGLILVDFKGSAGLGPLAQLPHALSVLSNFDVSAVERALEFLRADIHRREVDLQALGVNSYRDYLASCQAAGTSPRYPELLIVVDEFRMLIDSMPDAMAELMRIATIGRSLGLHLVLATQRPQGSISQDIRANIATSICLRVASAQDSYNLLEHESAAYISAAHPGAGYVRLPDGRSLPFRAPLVDAVPSSSDARPVQVLSLEEGGWRELTAASAVQTLGGNEDELLIRSAQQIRTLYEHEYAPKNLQKNAAVQDEYCPIPPELPESTPLPVVEAPVSEPASYGIDPAATPQEPADSGAASEGYLLGELEIARYGVRRSVSWSGQQTLALLAQSAERAPMLYGLLAQAFAARTPVVLLTSDGTLHRDLEPYAGAFEALVGAQELSHLRFCLEELHAPNLWGTEASTRPLIIVDGLDSWLEALVRQPDTENLLYDLLSQGCRRGYSVVFTSALNPRGRFAAAAHSTLLSRRFLDADLMRSTSKDYPTPAQSHYCVEGAINEELIGDQPLSASILSPCVAGFQELIQVLRGNAASASSGSNTRPGTLLRQFPEYYRMPSTEYVTAAHAA